ncbi:PorT family protein [Pontibacter sp. Tf4]|uniref:porin family protein n=1 Tax=Pontibacter sp. Tf4 TaxID=2761620 RepID=UPI00162A3A5E|nr:porin family protein [Pontibacter sp. Tf4]MBB6611179.1 PorT family protein [Pontibacter sp. Tf4]
MRKYLHFWFIASLLTIVCQPAFSQNEGPELRWGAKVGVNLARISDDPGLQDMDTGLGTEFGIYGRIGDRFYVQPGLDFVTYKTHIIRTVQPRPGERDAFVTNYLRVPALIGYRTNYEGSVLSHLRFFVGPAFAFNVGVKDNNLDVRRKDVRNAQFSLSGGAGFDIRFLNFDVTYHHGISTVFNNNNSEGKTKAFSLTAGIAF